MLTSLLVLFALSCLVSAVWLATRGETAIHRTPRGIRTPRLAPMPAGRRPLQPLTPWRAGQQPT
jgi:hypothetical protein